LYVHKCGSHDPIIDKFKTSSPKLCTRDVRNRICRAPVHLNEYDQFLDLFFTSGVIKANQSAAQDGHPHPDYLPRAKMTVYGGG
jgi:hypothetical protein